jgi:pimeloyl-ACP methyl ester carboxylesterase
MKKQILFLMLILGIGSISHAQNKSFHTAKAHAPEAGTMFIYPERIHLENGDLYNAERATMFVPLNRSVENSDVISLDVYRFKATEKADPNTPPIFYLHGGPNFLGLEDQLAVPGYFEKRWKFMLDVADVVVVSQRGIGPSKPTTLMEIASPPLSPDKAYNDEVATKDLQTLLTKGRKTWEDLGVDLKGFTILEADEDINDVRKALGYDKITIWGGSFGSHWGMTFMRMHPELVERVILRGIEGVDHTYDHPGHAWNVYKRVAEEAENSPRLKGLIPKGGLIKAVESIVKRMTKNPFTVEVKDPETNKMIKVLFDGHVAKKLSTGYSGGLQSWPADIITMYNGDYTKAAEKLVGKYNHFERKFKTASYYMLDCGSGISPERLKEYDADPANELMTVGWGYKAGCPCWDADLGDEFRTNFESDLPTLIVQGTWDQSTPYENAVEVAAGFSNCKFVNLKRGPHGAIRAGYDYSPEFKEALLKFVECGDTSDLGDFELPEPEWVIPEK